MNGKVYNGRSPDNLPYLILQYTVQGMASTVSKREKAWKPMGSE